MLARFRLVGCSVLLGLSIATTGSVSARVIKIPQHVLHIGLGPVVRSAQGGQIFGWDINQSGNDGFLAESISTGKYEDVSAIETFDQTTGKITKIASRQRSVNGSHELVAAAIVAGDVGLVDDERVLKDGRNDIYHLLAPVAGGKFTGLWNLPNDHDLILQSVADQQTDPTVAMVADQDTPQGGIPELVVSDVAANTFSGPLKFPAGQIWYGPQLVAQDTNLNVAIVGAQDFSSNLPDFVEFNLTTGKVTTFPTVQNGFGPFEGIALDSTTDTMCTTTGADYSVEFYNVKTHKGISEHLPGAGGELEEGGAIAADPINHLFLVTQPTSSVSPSGGSTIYVYNEQGVLQETLNGFSFSNVATVIYERVEVNAAHRVGYVNGPASNELQSFTY